MISQTFDVHVHFHAPSGQWTIDLRKTGCRRTLARYDSAVPDAFVESQAVGWADFLGATLTREPRPPAPTDETTRPCC